MPLTRGRDSEGPYYRWGAAARGGAKYHYAAGDARTREQAKSRALRQGKAISAQKKKGGGESRPPPGVAAATQGGPGKAKTVVGGRTPRKPRPKTISSAARARKKLDDRERVARVYSYRRAGNPSAQRRPGRAGNPSAQRRAGRPDKQKRK